MLNEKELCYQEYLQYECENVIQAEIDAGCPDDIMDPGAGDDEHEVWAELYDERYYDYDRHETWWENDGFYDAENEDYSWYCVDDWC